MKNTIENHNLIETSGTQFPTAAQIVGDMPPVNPMDWPLPCDVTVGHVTIRAGCRLRALVLRMQVLYGMAQRNQLELIAAQAAQEPIAEVVNKFGDPEAFAERELKIEEAAIQRLPVGTKLFTSSPLPASPLAIVQAALEAAVQCCPSGSSCDPQQISDAIRAIDQQAIIDTVSNKEWK